MNIEHSTLNCPKTSSPQPRMKGDLSQFKIPRQVASKSWHFQNRLNLWHTGGLGDKKCVNATQNSPFFGKARISYIPMNFSHHHFVIHVREEWFFEDIPPFPPSEFDRSLPTRSLHWNLRMWVKVLRKARPVFCIIWSLWKTKFSSEKLFHSFWDFCKGVPFLLRFSAQTASSWFWLCD